MNKGKETLKNLQMLKIAGFLFLFALFSGLAVAQKIVVSPTPKPKTSPKSKPTPKCVGCDEETPPTPATSLPKVANTAPKGGVTPTSAPHPTWTQGKIAENEEDFPVEKSILVDNQVNLKMCVSEGNIRINGWERDEVRVFVNGGTKAGFKVHQKSKQSGKPVLLSILGYDPLKDKEVGLDPCLSGEVIEIDVPLEATINLTGNEVEISIDSVAKALVKNESGDISLRQISQKIEARSYGGDILVQHSSGSMILTSIDGSILANNLEPREVGDAFKAKTNSGSVVVQSITHSVVELGSVSGLIRFSGEILSGGQYSFSTTSGNVLLAIPKDSSCTVNVVFEKGKFLTELPIDKLENKTPNSQIQKLTGQIGDGEASVNLINYSGITKIRKKN